MSISADYRLSTHSFVGAEVFVRTNFEIWRTTVALAVDINGPGRGPYVALLAWIIYQVVAHCRSAEEGRGGRYIVSHYQCVTCWRTNCGCSCEKTTMRCSERIFRGQEFIFKVRGEYLPLEGNARKTSDVEFWVLANSRTIVDHYSSCIWTSC